MASTNFSGLQINGAEILPGVGAQVFAGNVFFVDSGTGSDVGSSGTKDQPFATLDYAIGMCTASNGDIIVCFAGHAETLTAAIAVDVAGITILGLGNGENRPTFTLTATAKPAFTISAANVVVNNIRFYCATAGTSYLKNLIRIAASNVKIIGCELTINQVVTYALRIVSGDKVEILDCVFINKYAPGDAGGTAGIKQQDAVLNIGGTNVLVKGCRFNDIHADKAYRWKAVVEGGKLTASMRVEACQFTCRGIATRTRSAGASGFMSTVNCWAISPSSNTSAGALYTPTYQYIIQSYEVAAVNKQNLIAASTSDIRMKTGVVYL